MRFFFLGDEANLVVAHPHAAMRSIKVRIAAGTRMEFQCLCCFIKAPDPREGDVEMPHYQFGALLEHSSKLSAGIECQCYFCVQRGYADTFSQRLLRSGPLRDFAMQFAVRFAQSFLGALPFGNVSNERLDDLSSAPFNSGQGHLQWHIAPVRSARRPLKTGAAVGHALLKIFPGQFSGAFPIWLEGRRRISRMFTHEFLGALAP